MKHNLLLAFSFLCCSVFLAPSLSAASEEQITILESLGSVTMTSDSDEVMALQVNAKLPIGTRIQTGEDGTLLLQTEKGHTFRVSKNSDFRLDTYYVKTSFFNKNKSKDVIRISLKKGKLRSKLKHLGALKKASVRIKTPTAVAGIRGSDEVVMVNEMETIVISLDGDCYIEYEGVEVDLDPGEMGTATPDEGLVVSDFDPVAAPEVMEGLGAGVGGAPAPAAAPVEGGAPAVDPNTAPAGQGGAPQGAAPAGQTGGASVVGASDTGGGDAQAPPEAVAEENVFEEDEVEIVDVEAIAESVSDTTDATQEEVNEIVDELLKDDLPSPPSAPEGSALDTQQ